MVNMELISLSIGGIVYIIRRLTPVANKICDDIHKVKTTIDNIIISITTISKFINGIIDVIVTDQD